MTETRDTPCVSLVPTPWAVLCWACKPAWQTKPWEERQLADARVYLTEAEYERQVSVPGGWVCPQCGDEAVFDRDNYERHMSGGSMGDPDFVDWQRDAYRHHGGNGQGEARGGPDQGTPEQPHQVLFDFDGDTYDPAQDCVRLNRQLWDVAKAMGDNRWHTLHQLAAATGHPEASVSARLRDLRKRRFGAHQVDRRRKEDGAGTWQYRLRLRPGVTLEAPDDAL